MDAQVAQKLREEETRKEKELAVFFSILIGIFFIVAIVIAAATGHR